MITIFNREELLMTDSMRVQGEVRTALEREHIEYKIISRGRYAMRGIIPPRDNPDRDIYTYLIYVKEADLSRAQYAIKDIDLLK